MTLEFGLAQILVYLLVFVRLFGMLQLNPFFSRTSLPRQARMGLAVFLAMLLAPMQPAAAVEAVYAMNTFSYALAAIRELAIGAVFGVIFQLFYYFLFFVGDMVDTDIGFSMAKAFDPQTNIQTGFSSSLFTILFSLYFFLTGGHLALIRIFASTFEGISVGGASLNIGVVNFVLSLFTSVFSLVIRLAAPLMVAEFSMQVCMGILMKFVPQITIFVINFQMRIILGLLILYVIAPFIAQFVNNYIDVLFEDIMSAANILSSG